MVSRIYSALHCNRRLKHLSVKLETHNKEKLSIVAWKKAFSFTNDLQTAVESRKHDIFCESKIAPGEKCLEIQNCVNSAPTIIFLVSKSTLTNGEYGKIVFGFWYNYFRAFNLVCVYKHIRAVRSEWKKKNGHETKRSKINIYSNIDTIENLIND